MIIWNGMGFLVFVFVFGCSLVADLITNAVAGPGTYYDMYKWPFGVALIVAGALSWFVGQYLATRKARVLIDKETGEEVVIQPSHAFFFIKMHWWGPILAIGGIAVIVVELIK
jgi:hypothetical protein